MRTGFVTTCDTIKDAKLAAAEYARDNDTDAIVNLPSGHHLSIDHDGETVKSGGWVQRGWQAAIFTTPKVERQMA